MDTAKVDFPDSIAIVITGPFFVALTDAGMRANDMVVALPLIGVDGGSGLGEGVDMFFQGLLVGVMDHL